MESRWAIAYCGAIHFSPVCNNWWKSVNFEHGILGNERMDHSVVSKKSTHRDAVLLHLRHQKVAVANLYMVRLSSATRSAIITCLVVTFKAPKSRCH